MERRFIIDSDILAAMQAAQSNLVAGNTSGAAQSLTGMSGASPEERRKLSDRLGLTGSVLAPVIDVVSHPLVLIGGLLAWKFKLPTAEALQTIRSESDRLVKSFLPPLQHLGGLAEQYVGTKIPADIELATRRHVETVLSLRDKAMAGITEYSKKSGKPPTEDTYRRISAYLDGMTDMENPRSRQPWEVLRKSLPELGFSSGQATEIARLLQKPIRVSLSEDELKLATVLRSTFDDAWEGTLKHAVNNKDADEIMGIVFGNKGTMPHPTERIEQYWPRIALRDDVQISRDMQAYLDRKYPGLQKLRPDASVVSPEVAQDRGRLKERIGAMLPNVEDLEKLGADPLLLEAVSRYNTQKMAGRAYSYRIDEVLPQYYDTVGRVNAWTLPTADGVGSIGERMADNISKLYAEGTATAAMRANKLRDVYLPLAMGRLTKSQLSWSANWASMKEGAAELLNSGKLAEVIPQDTRKRLTNNLLHNRSLSYPEVGQTISNWFYNSTLAGNLTSAVANTAQPLLTLAPTIGFKNTIKGYQTYFNRMPKLLREIGANSSLDDAMRKVFPEFHAEHLELDPIARQEFYEALQANGRGGNIFKPKVGGALSKIQEYGLSVFAGTEQMNRLAAFYGSRERFLEAPAKQMYDAATNAFVPVTRKNMDTLASKWAAENVKRTQFGSGFAERPGVVADWWAPARQYTTFSLRTPAFMVNEGLRNPGVLSRAVLASGLAVGVGREVFGQDLSQQFLPGVLPLPTEDRPIPVMPPIFSLAGNAAMAATGVDSEGLRRQLPALVPLGVGISRGLGYVPGASGAAQFVGRSYADYGNVTPDGRVAVYSSNGGLKGYLTPTQIMVDAVFGGRNKTSQIESKMLEMEMGGRERIREMKRDMMQALYENDTDHYMTLVQEYNRAFPGRGESPLTQQDIKSLHARRDVARMERVLETLPTDVRSQYAAVFATAMGSDYHTYLGLSTGLAQSRTIMEREPFRAKKLSDTKAKVGESLHGVKLSEKLKQAGLDRSRPEMGFPDPLSNPPMGL